MSFATLTLILFLLSLFLIGYFIVRVEEMLNCIDYTILSSVPLLFVSLLVFSIIVANIPYEVEKSIDCELQTTNDGIQFVEFTGDEEVYEFVNVNKTFGKTFDEEDEFSIQIYKEGPYLGIYFMPKWDVIRKKGEK